MNDRRRTIVEPIPGLDAPPPILPPAGSPAPAPAPAPILPPLAARPTSGAQSALPPLPSAVTPARGSGTGTRPAPDPEPDCQVFRPITRPPMALLIILDDGSRKNGEHIRIRADRSVLGRETGDLIIPHDRLMSSRHAELVRELDRGRYRWFLSDLGSTNGTFVRFAKSPLKHDQQFLIGSKRYRYQQAQHPDAAAPPADSPAGQHKSTMGWQALSPADLQQTYPSLVELLPSGEDGPALVFNKDELKLGADPAVCSLVIRDDPFVGRVHAIIANSTGGPWTIQDANSVNGLWARVKSQPIDTTCEFQLGEQRFIFHPL
jgi:hypothetical protein